MAEETEAQKLLRLGNSRLNKTIKAIRSLRNLGSYKPSTTQTEMAFGILKKELESAYTAWKEKKKPEVADGVTLPKA